MAEKWKIELSEPTVVFQGEEGDQGWGKHQFPSLNRTVTDKIRLSWHYGGDFVGVQGKVYYRYLSGDNGKTWTEGWENTKPSVQMPNGKYYMGTKGNGTVHESRLPLEGRTPIKTFMDGRCRMYFAEDFRGTPEAEEIGLFAMSIYEYDPETGETNLVPCTVNWPNTPVCVYHTHYAYTVSGFLSLCGYNVFRDGDAMYYVCYGRGFDSTAPREKAVPEGFDGENSVYIFKSEDSGRTWDFLSQIMPDARIKAESVDYQHYESEYEGFTEPAMQILPNGDFFLLLRTGMTRTMFWSRSTDKGRTWSAPQKFDDFGVLPQILSMPCGAMLSVYGRPSLRLRVTGDLTARVWQDPVEMPISPDEPNYRNRSCFYVGLIPIGENTVLMAYTDFLYPNERGVRVRTILTRTITLLKE